MNLAQPTASTAAPGFGELLRAWRQARRQTQLGLSLATGVSARHLSYLETGRAGPSRDMVLALAQALEVPLRDRNALLQAAGFAAIYRETALDAPTLGPVRDAVQFLLGATEPNPTFVVNRRYDILDANATGRWILASFTEELARFAPPYNMARLLAHPAGMRPHLENWGEVARKVLGRVRRELGGAHTRDRADDALLADIAPTLAELGPPASPTDAPPILVGVQFRRGELAVRLFTTIATLGTPLDVTLDELRIEMLFPADEATRRVLASRPAPPGPTR
jgi:transcriptional regulator with XRE-family HTH domain